MSQIINNSTNLSKKKYRERCLGSTVMKLAELGGLDNTEALNSILNKTKLTCKKKKQSFYLGRLAEDKRFFEAVLESGGPRPPFYKAEKKLLNNMKRVVDSLDVAYVNTISL